MNRDSLIDPNNSKPYIDMSTGYTQDTYIGKKKKVNHY
jgi:hypothetical protein